MMHKVKQSDNNTIMKKYYCIPTTSVMDLSTIRTLMMAGLSVAPDPNAPVPARKNPPVGKLYI